MGCNVKWLTKRTVKIEGVTKINELNYKIANRSNSIPVAEKEIKKIEKDIVDYKSLGVEKLKPIEAFYENRVTNILNKLYKINHTHCTKQSNAYKPIAGQQLAAYQCQSIVKYGNHKTGSAFLNRQSFFL